MLLLKSAQLSRSSRPPSLLRPCCWLAKAQKLWLPPSRAHVTVGCPYPDSSVCCCKDKSVAAAVTASHSSYHAMTARVRSCSRQLANPSTESPLDVRWIVSVLSHTVLANCLRRGCSTFIPVPAICIHMKCVSCGNIEVMGSSNMGLAKDSKHPSPQTQSIDRRPKTNKCVL